MSREDLDEPGMAVAAVAAVLVGGVAAALALAALAIVMIRAWWSF